MEERRAVLPSVAWKRSVSDNNKEDRRTPNQKKIIIQEERAAVVCNVAERYPVWRYRRIAIVCRREGVQVSNKQVYRIMEELGVPQHLSRYLRWWVLHHDPKWQHRDSRATKKKLQEMMEADTDKALAA